MCFLSLVVWAKGAAPKKAKTSSKSSTTVVKKESGRKKKNSKAVATPAPVVPDTVKTNKPVDEDIEEIDELTNPNLTAKEREAIEARLKFEEEQRQDEYANSLRRRDWLKNRAIAQFGVGSRYPMMGESGISMGFGLGAEYITPIHLGAYASLGYVPDSDDPDFGDWELEGGFGYKVGLNYYFFPKNPMHLGISVSYGTVYFDHDIIPKGRTRPLITVNGYQYDILFSYLTRECYYFQFSIGMYYSPELGKDKKDNPSFRERIGSETDAEVVYDSKVVNPDGMSKTGIVLGLAVGYAFPELFPDATEKRRRERERTRQLSGQTTEE